MFKIEKQDFETQYFKHYESYNLEFKQSLASCPYDKIVETICGFLNCTGGYIIFGIKDDLQLTGIKKNSKMVDKFKLSIDSIIQTNKIVYDDDTLIEDNYVVIDEITNTKNQYFVIIQITPKVTSCKKYKLRNGNRILRLNASNYRLPTSKLYTESEMTSFKNNVTSNIEKQYKDLIYKMIIKPTQLTISTWTNFDNTYDVTLNLNFSPCVLPTQMEMTDVKKHVPEINFLNLEDFEFKNDICIKYIFNLF